MATSEGHGADTAHTATTEAEHGSGGLPQFQFQHWGGQIAWLLILFVILYVLIARVFTPRMRAVIDERANTISGALEAARQVQAEAADQASAAAAEVAEARAQSQRVAAEARARAAAQSAERAAVEEAKVSEQVAQAETRIAAMRDAAMSNVGAIAGETAAAIVEKLTGKAASPSDIKTALAARGGAA
jgi:F-type H+-transporting ATPase subunit b